MGAYKRIPENTFNHLQMNAGIICTSFDVGTGTVGGIVGASTGGIQIDATPEYEDMGDDVDNCPKNMMELKTIKSWECKIAGTWLTTSASAMKALIGSATVSGNHVTLKNKLAKEDFQTYWFVGDYGDAGFLAVRLANALNTSGLSLKTDDSNKGQLSFEYLGHYSMDAQDAVPLEIYIQDTVTTYPITYNLTNVTASIKPIEIGVNGSVVAKFEPNTSYELPTSVTVKVGSTTKTEDTDYTWDSTGGILHILPNVVTGDVTITVTGTAE
jgi:hypothetical protein